MNIDSLKRKTWHWMIRPFDTPTRDRIRWKKNELKRVGLFVRGAMRKAIGNGNKPVRNVYHCCLQKTGSQWIKRVFDDPEVRDLTGLACHPQLPYDGGYFKGYFPAYTFVPGLYVPYELYDQIEKTDPYRSFYVMRDPRDLIVSWYYSTKYTHPLIGDIPEYRTHLNEVSVEEGIAFSIRHLGDKLSQMRDWWRHRDDSELLVVRFEDLVSDPVKEFGAILRHCGYGVSREWLQEILSRYTKEKMRKRDLKRRNGERSHYRKDRKGWRDLFTDQHRELFRSANGHLVQDLGYSEWS